MSDKHLNNKTADKLLEEETALIERIKAGDYNAYGILVTRYQNRLLQFLYKKFGSHHMVEDIVQLAFLKAFERLDSFQFRSKFFTWLSTIAYREMINTVCEEKRRPQFINEKQLDPENGANYFDSCYDEESLTVEEELIHEEKIRTLRELFDLVPKKLIEPLLLSTEEGLSYKEIAERLGVSVDSVRSRINRARSELKTLIKERDIKL